MDRHSVHASFLVCSYSCIVCSQLTHHTNKTNTKDIACIMYRSDGTVVSTRIWVQVRPISDCTPYRTDSFA